MKHSMTVAGIGSLGIARLLLSRNPQAMETLVDEPEVKPKKAEKTFGVLEKVTPKDAPDQQRHQQHRRMRTSNRR